MHKSKRLKREYKMSLQHKTLVMLIILLFFFCTMFVVTTLLISKRAEDDFKKRTSEIAVNNVVSTINSSLANYNYLLRLLMIDDGVVSFLHAEIADKSMIYETRMSMLKIINMYSYIDSVCLIRQDDGYVNTGQGTYEIDFNNIERNKIVAAHGTNVISINGNGLIKKKGTRALLTMSRAIYDINSQKLLGILILSISNHVFDDALTLQNSGGMCIVNDQGMLLSGDEEIGALYKEEYNSERIVYKNVKLEGGKKTLTGKHAVIPLVVLCASGKGAEAVPRDTIYALMLILIAFLLSALVCAWFITVNIARPIANLSSAMERTRSSGWLEKIEASMPNNELNMLAESYNSMIDYLNQLFNRLLEEEKDVQKAEMRVLQEQIKPHFLYNTLETISYMAVEVNANKVHDALEILGDFYRNFLSKGDREIPLKRELRITQDYLSLQKLRYGDIFEDVYDIDDTSYNYMIPKLILQPLVENSIYHGVRLKGEKCVIRITTHMEEDGLKILVYDSGVGMSDEKIQSILKSCKNDGEGMTGFGLRGTINRIRYYCDCDNVVQIHSEIGEYTEIEIFIPRIKEKEVEGDGRCTE